MARPRTKGVYRWKKGVRGVRQLELGVFMQEPKKRITYPQKWHEYNLSQTSEKLMFMSILDELCQYVKCEEHRGKGRPKLNLREVVYCMCMLIYNGKSSRRTISELHISKDKHYISRVPHFNSILNYFNNKDLREQLQYLIRLSSMPLKCIEQDFAVDSSGFTTSVFGRWFDTKYNSRADHRLWRKAHVMSGVKTNVITSIEVAKGSSSDTIMFPGLVEKTHSNFEMREVSADKAYSSRHNLQFTSEKGAIPFIPFPRGRTAKSKGYPMWRQMFYYFQDHYEEFMEHYHKRSNAETVFAMMKRKLGMHLRCKNETAQDNEILCKALCHNIIVLIHEVFELGIDIEFEKHANICANASPAQIISHNN